ncbi:MAG: septum formation inhibitor Maf [Coleofasciculaceae cyanobacterium SM2_1_6]|nr:septum formation inhibitor Maf [Coleofasciculaceae cyanobacterium SM2_1_6]
MKTFVLASASPARKRLLTKAGINPVIRASDFDESLVQLANPQELVNTLAEKKAATVAKFYPEAVVLGCDSILAIDGEIHGKPRNAAEAIERWQFMSGKVGTLYTGHCLIAGTQVLIKCGITKVYFATVSDREIKDYVATGEPLTCAGCFALEGRGGLFVENLIGCHSNVIGLSLPLLRTMLQDLGYQLADFWDL